MPPPDSTITVEERDVLNLARDWRGAATGDLETVSPHRIVHRFIKLWISFNALYTLHSPNQAREKPQLEALAKWQPFVDSHSARLGQDTYLHALRVLDDPGVYSYIRRARVRIPAPHSPHDSLLATYQVRCNLFHGRKHPADMRDGQLIQASSVLVSAWVDDLLAYDGPWA